MWHFSVYHNFRQAGRAILKGDKMSSIYFHSSDNDDVCVSGSERAHFGIFCSDVTFVVLGRDAEEWREPSILRNAFPDGHRILTSHSFEDALRIYLSGDSDPMIIEDESIPIFPFVLNTAFSLGSDYVKLCARIHGQCEIHAYVEPANMTWLSDIIKRGREEKFYRDNMGWEKVVQLLETGSNEPIVMSYSVCEQFPNAHVANFEYPILGTGELDYDAWYDLPYLDRWEMAIRALRELNSGLELKPDNWNDFYFGNGMSASKLLALLYARNK